MQKNLLNKEKESLYLANGQKILLNKQQIAAISAINDFLKSPKMFFLLSGYAGTGKTTIIKRILEKYRGRAIVSASTKKASLVISQATLFDGFTIHTLLGLRPDVKLEGFNPNDPEFSQVEPALINRYNLIIIDEASMINGSLFDLIKFEVNKSLTTKIIFIGDKAQIPPIDEDQSVVFEIEDFYELTSLVRQKQNNPLVKLSKELRYSLNNGELPEFILNRQTLLNAKGEGIYFCSSNEEFREKISECFEASNFNENINYAKLIAWRNKTVMKSNQIIRELTFGVKVNLLEKSDILTGYRAVRDAAKKNFIINNCVDYMVSSISDRVCNKNGLFGYNVFLLEKSKIFKTFDEKHVFIVDHLDAKNLYNYAEIHDKLLAVSRADKNWVSYYEFRKNNLLMTDILKNLDGSNRFKNNEIKKDLDYGFAVTSHKAQGSTYDTVFILLKDILLNSKKREMQQMLYVALTRSSNKVVVL
ncbi:ATP-dependent DNA helicase [Francisella frigiditurris]|uniref:PIF1-like helicase family protein n=1 Tax=Francisella frigiditurris TaxID=1542390 RepID=A0A1J0KU72_9GAMM|nr:AAA family ATPase [Francisella frigiditurris]APC97198.1 PIF1-like helicase family protein [Francisella frigiditurris]